MYLYHDRIAKQKHSIFEKYSSLNLMDFFIGRSEQNVFVSESVSNQSNKMAVVSNLVHGISMQWFEGILPPSNGSRFSMQDGLALIYEYYGTDWVSNTAGSVCLYTFCVCCAQVF